MHAGRERRKAPPHPLAPLPLGCLGYLCLVAESCCCNPSCKPPCKHGTEFVALWCLVWGRQQDESMGAGGGAAGQADRSLSTWPQTQHTTEAPQNATSVWWPHWLT